MHICMPAGSCCTPPVYTYACMCICMHACMLVWEVNMFPHAYIMRKCTHRVLILYVHHTQAFMRMPVCSFGKSICSLMHTLFTRVSIMYVHRTQAFMSYNVCMLAWGVELTTICSLMHMSVLRAWIIHALILCVHYL